MKITNYYEIDQETIQQVAQAHLNFFRERFQTEYIEFGHEKAMMPYCAPSLGTDETAEDYLEQTPNFDHYQYN